MGKQILAAMDHAHSNKIVHRDLNLQNILVNGANELKVIDYGFAFEESDKRITRSCGTPDYLAPEMVWPLCDHNDQAWCGCNDAKNPYYLYDRGIDMWAVGVIAFKLLSGDFPLDINDGEYDNLLRYACGDNTKIKPIPSFISEEAKDFIRKCLTLSDRETAADAIKHPWFKKEYLTVKKLKGETLKSQTETK